MNVNVDKATEFCKSIFTETEKILVDQIDNDLKFPQLISLVSSKLNVSSDEQKVVDPFVRFYVKFHPDFHASRGAKGGIEKMEDYQTRAIAKATKASLKKELVAEIDARIAATEVDSEEETPVSATG